SRRAASITRLRVSGGMDFAEGELFNTSETVVCDSSRCSASIFKLTCPGGFATCPFVMMELYHVSLGPVTQKCHSRTDFAPKSRGANQSLSEASCAILFL